MRARKKLRGCDWVTPALEMIHSCLGSDGVDEADRRCPYLEGRGIIVRSATGGGKITGWDSALR